MKCYSLSSRNQPYLVVLGGFLINLSIGNFYTSGNMQTEIVLYMQNHSLSGNSVRSSNSLWISCLLVFGLGASLSTGGFLAKKIGSSLTVFIGGWIMSINVILAYYTIKTYLSILALTYGLLAGLGTGLAYGVALGAPIKWFPKHKGLIIGIVVSGFGLSPTIFDIIQNFVVKFYGSGTLERLPISFVILGCSYAIMQIFGSILLREDSEIKEINDNSIQSNFFRKNSSGLFSTKSRSVKYNDMELKPHEIIFEFDFWILWLTILLNGSSIPIFSSLHNVFGKKIGLTNTDIFGQLTLINIIGGFCNAMGRIFWGYLTIRKPYKVIMITLCITNALFMGSFYFLNYIEDKTILLYVFGLWVAMINFFHGGNLSVFPTICEKLFGLKNFVCNYGLLFTAYSITAIIVSTIAVSVSQTEQKRLCLKLFTISSGMSIVGAGLTLLFRGKSLIASRH